MLHHEATAAHACQGITALPPLRVDKLSIPSVVPRLLREGCREQGEVGTCTVEAQGTGEVLDQRPVSLTWERIIGGG